MKDLKFFLGRFPGEGPEIEFFHDGLIVALSFEKLVQAPLGVGHFGLDLVAVDEGRGPGTGLSWSCWRIHKDWREQSVRTC